MTPRDDDIAARAALHRLLENLGSATGVLRDLREYLERMEARDRRFVRLIARAGVIFAFGMVVALVVTSCEVRQTNAATQRADDLVHDNRQLIRRLEVVAVQAQRNGAKADLRQCRQIEALKTRLRAILYLAAAQRGGRQTPSLHRALRLLRRESCAHLPNAAPVTP